MDYKWVFEYLNKPWKPHAYGPNEFDCWGFVYDVFKKIKGVEIERFQYVDPHNGKLVQHTFKNSVNVVTWQLLEKPVDFAVVLLGRSKYPTHCGIYLNVDGGVIVHCSERGGVTIVSLNNLYEQLQLKAFGFYLHKDLK